MKVKVYKVTKEHSKEDWKEIIDKYDVFVAHPRTVSPYYYETVSPPPSDLFDLIIVNEAHHEPAESWRELLKHFPKSKKILFTATPFRRDRQLIDGNIVFHYPLEDALNDGIISEIKSVVVQERTDKALIKKLKEVLENIQNESGIKPHFMARAETIDKSCKTCKLYKNEGLKVEIVSSDNDIYENLETIQSLLFHTSRDELIDKLLSNEEHGLNIYFSVQIFRWNGDINDLQPNKNVDDMIVVSKKFGNVSVYITWSDKRVSWIKEEFYETNCIDLHIMYNYRSANQDLLFLHTTDKSVFDKLFKNRLSYIKPLPYTEIMKVIQKADEYLLLGLKNVTVRSSANPTYKTFAGKDVQNSTSDSNDFFR